MGLGTKNEPPGIPGSADMPSTQYSAKPIDCHALKSKPTAVALDNRHRFPFDGNPILLLCTYIML